MRPNHASSSSDRASRRTSETFGSETFWGDKVKALKEDGSVLRVGFLNVGGFPTTRHSSKMHHFKKLVGQHSFEVFSMAEMNSHWDKLPPHARPYKTLFGWQDHSPRIVLSHFRNTTAPGTHVFGGTAMLLSGLQNTAVEKSGGTPEAWAVGLGHATKGKGMFPFFE